MKSRPVVVTALGIAQILGWGSSFYFPAVLAAGTVCGRAADRAFGGDCDGGNIDRVRDRQCAAGRDSLDHVPTLT
jgi:hypothetical protein